MKNFTLNVWNLKNTVFTINELSQIIPNNWNNSLKLKISNYAKKWYITRIGKWLYTLPNYNINPFELINKKYSPSYISFWTALYHHWLIFQANPNEIDLAYKKSQLIKLENLDLEINLKCFKEDILLNPEWIINNWLYSIAWKERSFLDTIYLNPNYYFDNLDILDKNKITELIWIYKKDKMMKKRVLNYFPKLDLWMQ